MGDAPAPKPKGRRGSTGGVASARSNGGSGARSLKATSDGRNSTKSRSRAVGNGGRDADGTDGELLTGCLMNGALSDLLAQLDTKPVSKNPGGPDGIILDNSLGGGEEKGESLLSGGPSDGQTRASDTQRPNAQPPSGKGGGVLASSGLRDVIRQIAAEYEGEGDNDMLTNGVQQTVKDELRRVHRAATRETGKLLEDLCNDDANINLDSVMTKSVHVAQRLLHSDKVTVFLYDKTSDQLWSRWGSGLPKDILNGKARPIRMRANQGLAGHAYSTQQPLNIPDAYESNLFNKAIDRDTGYTTKSVLVVPLFTRPRKSAGDSNKKKLLGVIQFINKLYGDEEAQASNPQASSTDDDLMLDETETMTIEQPMLSLDGISQYEADEIKVDHRGTKLMVTSFSRSDEQKAIGFVEAAGRAINWVTNREDNADERSMRGSIERPNRRGSTTNYMSNASTLLDFFKTPTDKVQGEKNDAAHRIQRWVRPMLHAEMEEKKRIKMLERKFNFTTQKTASANAAEMRRKTRFNSKPQSGRSTQASRDAALYDLPSDTQDNRYALIPENVLQGRASFDALVVRKSGSEDLIQRPSMSDDDRSEVTWHRRTPSPSPSDEAERDTIGQTLASITQAAPVPTTVADAIDAAVASQAVIQKAAEEEAERLAEEARVAAAAKAAEEALKANAIKDAEKAAAVEAARKNRELRRWSSIQRLEVEQVTAMRDLGRRRSSIAQHLTGNDLQAMRNMTAQEHNPDMAENDDVSSSSSSSSDDDDDPAPDVSPDASPSTARTTDVVASPEATPPTPPMAENNNQLRRGSSTRRGSSFGAGRKASVGGGGALLPGLYVTERRASVERAAIPGTTNAERRSSRRTSTASAMQIANAVAERRASAEIKAPQTRDVPDFSASIVADLLAAGSIEELKDAVRGVFDQVKMESDINTGAGNPRCEAAADKIQMLWLRHLLEIRLEMRSRLNAVVRIQHALRPTIHRLMEHRAIRIAHARGVNAVTRLQARVRAHHLRSTMRTTFFRRGVAFIPSHLPALCRLLVPTLDLDACDTRERLKVHTSLSPRRFVARSHGATISLTRGAFAGGRDKKRFSALRKPIKALWQESENGSYTTGVGGSVSIQPIPPPTGGYMQFPRIAPATSHGSPRLQTFSPATNTMRSPSTCPAPDAKAGLDESSLHSGPTLSVQMPLCPTSPPLEQTRASKGSKLELNPMPSVSVDEDTATEAPTVAIDTVATAAATAVAMRAVANADSTIVLKPSKQMAGFQDMAPFDLMNWHARRSAVAAVRRILRVEQNTHPEAFDADDWHTHDMNDRIFRRHARRRGEAERIAASSVQQLRILPFRDEARRHAGTPAGPAPTTLRPHASRGRRLVRAK